jgi:hypothetical protein
MIGRLRNLAALAVACSSLAVVQAATGVSPAIPSSAPQAAQTQSPPPVHQSRAETTPIPIEATYRSMIEFWTWDHYRIQREIREAKPGEKPIDEGRNYRLEMGITREQDQLILDTILTTSSRLIENERQYNIAARRWRSENMGHLATATPDPEVKRLSIENTKIIHSLIDTLKSGLGADDFAKFDKFVNAHWGNGQMLAPLIPQGVQP